jgi:quercetin dioxygenase-like cupin family protein
LNRWSQWLIFLVLIASLGSAGSALGQQATPGLDNPAIEILAQGTVDELEPRDDAPIELWIVRFTFAAGALTSLGNPLGVLLIYVESGELTVQESLDQEVILAAGDSRFFAAGRTDLVRNDGDEPARLLVFLSFPAIPLEAESIAATADRSAPPPSPGLVAVGRTDQMPSGPFTVTLERLTIPPASALPQDPTVGPEIGIVDGGVVTVSIEEGEAGVLPDGLTPESQIDESIILPAGESADLRLEGFYYRDEGSGLTLQNESDVRATIIRVVISADS